MSSDQLIQIWTLHKKNELMTIGMSTETGVCQIHGQASQDLRYTKIQPTSRADHTWPDAWTRIGKAAQRREKQECAIEKPKLEYARNVRVIYSIDPIEEEYKDIIKNATRKLDTPMAAAMPCKRAFSKGKPLFQKKKKTKHLNEDKIQLYH